MNNLRKMYYACRNKLTNKMWGYVRIPEKGKKKGDVLLSYITTPFTLFPWQHKTDPHSNYWECAEIARLFSIRGYRLDAISASEHRFIPKKKYDICIDTQQDLERLYPFLPKNSKKVIHIDNPYYKIYNEREKQRLADLKSRRGRELLPKRQVAPSRSVALADYLEGFGNESVYSTYNEFGKPIFPIPVSVVRTFDFPESKNWQSARKHFLYFGGGGAVLKGLDIAVEAFAQMPDYTLHILGPSAFEPDFAKEYEKEFSLPNIIRYGRPKIDARSKITVNGQDVKEIFDKCIAIVYPSSAEGTSTAVMQSIHAGLIPITTPETGLSREIGGIILPKPTIESVKKAVLDISQMNENELKQTAMHSWKYAREHHTRDAFSRAYDAFITRILKI